MLRLEVLEGVLTDTFTILIACQILRRLIGVRIPLDLANGIKKLMKAGGTDKPAAYQLLTLVTISTPIRVLPAAANVRLGFVILVMLEALRNATVYKPVRVRRS